MLMLHRAIAASWHGGMHECSITHMHTRRCAMHACMRWCRLVLLRVGLQAAQRKRPSTRAAAPAAAACESNEGLVSTGANLSAPLHAILSRHRARPGDDHRSPLSIAAHSGRGGRRPGCPLQHSPGMSKQAAAAQRRRILFKPVQSSAAAARAAVSACAGRRSAAQAAITFICACTLAVTHPCCDTHAACVHASPSCSLGACAAHACTRITSHVRRGGPGWHACVAAHGDSTAEGGRGGRRTHRAATAAQHGRDARTPAAAAHSPGCCSRHPPHTHHCTPHSPAAWPCVCDHRALLAHNQQQQQGPSSQPALARGSHASRQSPAP